jgi:hypothetical protein
LPKAPHNIPVSLTSIHPGDTAFKPEGKTQTWFRSQGEENAQVANVHCRKYLKRLSRQKYLDLHTQKNEETGNCKCGET